MAAKYWLDSNDNWNTPADWTGNTVPGSSDDVTVYQGSPHVTAPIAIRSLTDSSPASVSFENAGANTISTNLTLSGYLSLDAYYGEGGTTLSVATQFTNTGTLQIGNGGLKAPTSFTTHYIANTGTIELDGSGTKQASLIVNYPAGFGTAYTVTGTVRLFGNTLVSFSSGQIKTIAANSSLRLDGATAYVADAGSTTSNSALAGLSTISHNGNLLLDNGAAVAAAANLANNGAINIDYYYSDGGASLSVGSKLTNNGLVQIGNGGLSAASSISTHYLTNKGTIELDGSGTAQASLKVNYGAGFGTTATVTGTVRLFGNTLIAFQSGQISTLAAGASLRLDGNKAFVADVGSSTSNSALTGLGTISHGANLMLDNGATVAAAGNLFNTGAINIDSYYTEGGASLAVGSKLTNAGSVQIGNGGLGSASAITTKYISNTGTIELDGTASTQASLAVNYGAGFGTTATVTGTVRLFGDTLVSFASGEIKTLAANSYLRLEGAKARVADLSDTSSNSALTGLTTVDAGAAFLLVD